MKKRDMSFFEFNNSIFSMIREISQKIDTLLMSTAQEYGITTLQLKMIITLSSRGEAISMGNLGKSVGVTGGNISNICKKLEKAGFVNRIRSVEDERVVNVELTEMGEKACDSVEVYFDKIRNDIPKDVSGVHMDTIIKELEELNKLLDKYMDRSGY